MRPFLTMVVRILGEARWMLAINSALMFLFGWLNTFIAGRMFADFVEQLDREELGPRNRNLRRMMESMGVEDLEMNVGLLEMTFWLHPFLWLPVVIWAIGRGSLAVGGELERGSMDVVLSRPISRTSYLSAHLTAAVAGLILLPFSLILGNRIASYIHPIEAPPTLLLLSKPAANLALLGLAIYGLTLLVSASDRVRWRATLIGTGVTLFGFVGQFLASLDIFQGQRWAELLRKVSLFQYYNPAAAITDPNRWSVNLAVLAIVAFVGITLAFLIFQRRDLPASG